MGECRQNMTMRHTRRVGRSAGRGRAVGVLMLCAMLLAGCEIVPRSPSSLRTTSEPTPTPFDFGDNNPDVVVAMGDSVTAGSAISGPSYPRLVAGMSGKVVINEGIGGEWSSGGLARIGSVLASHKPGYVFIMYGINDEIHVGSVNWTISNLRQMIHIVKESKAYPIVGTIPPRATPSGANRHAALNARIRQLCEEENVTLADVELAFNEDYTLMLEDGFHPNENGNLLIAMVFNEALPLVPPNAP